MTRRLARFAFDRGFLLGLAVLVAYVWLAPTTIVAGDNAEFATLGAVGGRAHPSGYPLYVLWLRALAWLPAASAAHRAAIATALLAGLQTIVLHAACRAWGARPSAAALAVATFAAAPIVLRVHTEADVFALNSLVGAAILWLAAATGPVRGTWRCGLLGLVAGLGLANNLTCVLLAPIGLLGVVRGMREGSVRTGILVALGGLALGMLPYAYLVVAPDAASWGPIDSFDDLVGTFLRRDYGYASHRPDAPSIPLLTSLGAHAMLVGRSFLWAPALLGLGTLAWRCVRGADRWGWAMLALSWLLAGPVFAWRLDVDPSGVGGYIGGRMQILSAVVLAIPVARGLEVIAARTQREIRPALAAGFAVLWFGGLAALALPRLARVHSAVVEVGVRNQLRALPPDSILIVVSDDQCFGTQYLQLALGERRDVTLVCWALARHRWYRERLAHAGLTLARTDGGVATVAQGEALLATGRPLVVDRAQTAILGALPSQPLGVLVRVLPRGARVPSLGEVVELQREVYAAFDFDYPRPTRDDDFGSVAHVRYAQPWQLLATQLLAAGDRAGAVAAHELAEQLAPLPAD